MTINYEELYMDTLYHYLAEIYFISDKINGNKEQKINEYTNKIKKKYTKDNIDDINKLIELIENNEDNDLKNFKKKLYDIIIM